MKKTEGAYQVEWEQDAIIGGREIDGQHRTIYTFRRFQRMSDSEKETLIERYEGYYTDNGVVVRV